MSYRKPLIGLAVFLAISLALTWTVLVTLQRSVQGSTKSYTAVFTDVSGLTVGDDVRMAGVRVGRVDSIALDGTLARVSFRVQDDQVMYGNTKASITYQNIIGQRYLGLSLGNYNDPRVLPNGGEIPLSHTEPSFDISLLLNGFEPLFSVLDPKQVDNITTAIVQALQGNAGSVTTLVAETSKIAESFAGPDRILGDIIVNLDTIVRALAQQSGNIGTVITQARTIFDQLSNKRAQLMNSLDSISSVVGRVSTIVGNVQPDLQQLLNREPGFTKHFLDKKDAFDYFGSNLPLMLKGIARVSQEGAYVNAYVCDFNVTLMPALTTLIPTIVSMATPAGRPTHSEICR
ncbi:MCE family protein [Nocardia miyunensis]|uniref:MCE family protein n=1 Tax=Nocardia miyunensis TaxID=282684 RepID=UPI000830DC8D|nr:MlaD family protein [Nocardia miyunensis]